jgi:hypothetical protein
MKGAEQRRWAASERWRKWRIAKAAGVKPKEVNDVIRIAKKIAGK